MVFSEETKKFLEKLVLGIIEEPNNNDGLNGWIDSVAEMSADLVRDIESWFKMECEQEVKYANERDPEYLVVALLVAAVLANIEAGKRAGGPPYFDHKQLGQLAQKIARMARSHMESLDEVPEGAVT